MKKRTIIAMLLLTCIMLSACGQKPASNTSSDKATSQITVTENNQQEAKTPPEPPNNSKEGVSKTTVEPKVESKVKVSSDTSEDPIPFMDGGYHPNEDWPDWFRIPSAVPEDEELKQTLQKNKDFHSLPEWMQALAVRPRSVVVWLEGFKIFNSNDSGGKDVSLFLKQHPEYIVPLLERLRIVLEKADSGEWVYLSNPPEEYVEMQQIVDEILEQLE